MRIVIDTNVFVSALLVPGSRTAELIAGWRKVFTSAAQLEELAKVTRYPKIRERLHALIAGRLINEIKSLAEWGRICRRSMCHRTRPTTIFCQLCKAAVRTTWSRVTSAIC